MAVLAEVQSCQRRTVQGRQDVPAEKPASAADLI